jgi:hypothetical protein
MDGVARSLSLVVRTAFEPCKGPSAHENRLSGIEQAFADSNVRSNLQIAIVPKTLNKSIELRIFHLES